MLDHKYMSLWSQLDDNIRARAVKREWDEYNESIGFSLGQLGGQPHDIQGRESEIRLLHAILERPRTPVALLLAAAGTGKTALVEQFAKDLNSGTFRTELKHEYLLVAIRVGNLAAIGVSKLQSTLATLFNTLGEFEKKFQKALNKPNLRIVAFIDEVHMLVTIFGPGTKIGGDVMKDVLARAPIRVIAATTKREYDSTIAVDKPLSERFKQIELREVSRETVKMIARDWWMKVAPDCAQLYPDDDVIDRMIEANAMYRSDSAEPRKSLDILEDLVSYSRRTGQQADFEQLVSIFSQRYSINLDFKVKADAVYAEIERRIEGQPHALFTLRRLLRSMVFQLDRVSDRPMATALLTGSTGTGKALPDDTLIPADTESGYVRMGDIRAGEVRVVNRYGKFVDVLGVYPQEGEHAVYRVTLADGRTLDCNGEHLFSFVYEENKKSRSPELMTETVEFMQTVLDRGVYIPDSDPDVVFSDDAEDYGFMWVGIRDIMKSAEYKTMTCILVDDEEHLFQAGTDHVVTHNTETVKAISHALYPGENVILHLNMPDYKLVEHEAEFRKRLGEFVRHTPNAIVLMDELEKADPNILDSLLYILDEGRVSFDTMNREGRLETNTISLRNTIVFATTNAGQEVFATDAMYSQRGADQVGQISDVDRAAMDQLTKNLVSYLVEGHTFKPEMMGRFDRIVPYRALSETTLLRITERQLTAMMEKFKESRGIELSLRKPADWSDMGYDYTTTDVALFIAFIRARADKSDSGGARNIAREIKMSVQDAVIDAVLDHPDSKRFEIFVSRDSAVHNQAASPSEGGVCVEPIDAE